MSATVITPSRGRGAWPSDGAGGTLSSDGKRIGRYYRAPADGRPMIGLIGYRADRDSTTVDLNDYATFRATIAVQHVLSVVDDGLWGEKTGAALRKWQDAHGLYPDGVYGPASARAMWTPEVIRFCAAVGAQAEQQQLIDLACGHIGIESLWDHGAIGVLTPQDIGIDQGNRPSHPAMSLDDWLDPPRALAWLAVFERDNLAAFNGNIRDAAAAYNLGQGGCRAWIKAGRPDVWTRTVNGVVITTRVTDYINRVLAG